MSNMESLEKQLANQKEEHKATIHSLEMKALLEKKRFQLLIDLQHYMSGEVMKYLRRPTRE